jgi:hypothetical protein
MRLLVPASFEKEFSTKQEENCVCRKGKEVGDLSARTWLNIFYRLNLLLFEKPTILGAK